MKASRNLTIHWFGLARDIFASYSTQVRNPETKKSPPDACTYPLWDYPLLEVNDCYLSNPILLTEAFQELSYRFIASSSNSLSSYTHAEHERLIEKTVSILKELGFSSIQKNIKFRINRQDTAQFDILAKKSHGFWHFECKTKRLPWRWRMFHVSKELEKEALDFLEESSLSLDKWNKKTQSLKEYLEQTASCTNPEISSIVVTDAPNPASCVCSYVDMVWVDRLQKYLDQKIAQ